MNKPIIVSENYLWLESEKIIRDIDNPDIFYPESSIEGKIKVYEDRVNNWFLRLAQKMVKTKSREDYIAVSVAISYIEAVEQYRQGKETPDKKSGEWFKKSAKRIFSTSSSDAIKRLWEEGRCGLFHCGFTNGKTYLSHDGSQALEVKGERLEINPNKFVEAVVNDFNKHIKELYISKPDSDVIKKFLELWDTRWKNS